MSDRKLIKGAIVITMDKVGSPMTYSPSKPIPTPVNP